MTYSILGGSVPRVSAADPGTSRGNRISSALDSIHNTLGMMSGAEKKRRDLLGEQEANADIVQQQVDPNRVANEKAYSMAVTRNNVKTRFDRLMSDINNPASEVSKMDAEEFPKYLTGLAREFHNANKGSKYAQENNDIFDRFVLANNQKLIAAHAAKNKERVRTGLQNEAVSALSSVDHSMDPEAYDRSVDSLIETMLPSTQFTEVERQALIMVSATNAARQGDGRMLAYANRRFDGSNVYPRDAAAANRELRAAKDQQNTDMWNDRFVYYAEKSRSGTFDEVDYNMLMRNEDAIKNLGGRGVIEGWYTKGIKQRHTATMIKQYHNQFIKGDPIIGATTDQINEVVSSVFAQGLNNGEPKLNTLRTVANGLSKQNIVATDIKQSLSSALGRPIWTPEVAKNEQFKTAFTTASVLDDYMDNDQLQRQLGEDAFDNYNFIKDYMAFNGSNFEDAIAAMSSAIQQRKKHNLEMHLSSKEYELMNTAVEDVMQGNLDTSDPNISSWLGMVSKTDNAILTGPVKADLNRQAEQLILRGFTPSVAVRMAAKKVAAKYQTLGGEMVYTNGAPMGNMIGMPKGASNDATEEAFEFFCEQRGLDPSNSAPQFNGGMVTIVDRETFEESVPVPAELIGRMWQQKQLNDIKVEEAEDEEERNYLMNKKANSFQRFIYEQVGEFNPKALVVQMPDGKRIDVQTYERADLDTKIEYQKQWEYQQNEGWRQIAKTLVTAGDWWGGKIEKAFSYFAETPTVSKADIIAMKEGKRIRNDLKLTPEERAKLESIRPANEPAEPAAPAPAPAKKPTGNEATKLQSQLMKHEGFRGKPYKDSVGVLTVGYGRNLEANPITAAEWEQLGGMRDLNKTPLTTDEAKVLLNNDIEVATKEAASLFDDVWSTLSENRKNVLIDMTFNLGTSRLSKFKEMRKALVKGDYDEAAKQMKKSAWYKQVGRRAKTLINTMKKG